MFDFIDCEPHGYSAEIPQRLIRAHAQEQPQLRGECWRELRRENERRFKCFMIGAPFVQPRPRQLIRLNGG